MAPVRSVQRALAIIRLMASRDTWTLQQLANESSLAKATLHRLLHTMEIEGFVHSPRGLSGVYRLTGLVSELGAGLAYSRYAEAIVEIATGALGWPVSFAMPEGPAMRVVACGMPFDQAHSSKPTSVGRWHGVFTSAVGLAFLSACSDAGVEDLWQRVGRHQALDEAADPVVHRHRALAQVAMARARGYAIRVANGNDLNSAIAVPVLHEGHPVGALACSTFPRSLSDAFIDRTLEH